MKKITLLAALIISGVLTAWVVNNTITKLNAEQSNQIHRTHIIAHPGKMLHTAD